MSTHMLGLAWVLHSAVPPQGTKASIMWRPDRRAKNGSTGQGIKNLGSAAGMPSIQAPYDTRRTVTPPSSAAAATFFGGRGGGVGGS